MERGRFPGRLRWELKKTAPRVEDLLALAYRGVIPSKKKGLNDAYDYAVAVERNPETVVVEQNNRGNDVLAGSNPVPTLPDDDDVLEESDDEPGEEEADAIPF